MIKEIPPHRVASVRRVVPTFADMGQLFGELFAHLGRLGVAPAGPPLAIYYVEEFKDQDVDIEVVIPIGTDIQESDTVKVRELEAGKQMACAVHKGPYDMISAAYHAVMEWVGNNGYRISDYTREVYLTDPNQVKDPNDYVTEVQVPVEKA
jgi:effector-binding domain-containing protein